MWVWWLIKKTFERKCIWLTQGGSYFTNMKLEIYARRREQYLKSCFHSLATLLPWESCLFQVSSWFARCSAVQKQISQQNRFVSQVTSFAESLPKSSVSRFLWNTTFCNLPRFFLFLSAGLSAERAILELADKKWGCPSSCRFLQRSHFVWHSPRLDFTPHQLLFWANHRKSYSEIWGAIPHINLVTSVPQFLSLAFE